VLRDAPRWGQPFLAASVGLLPLGGVGAGDLAGDGPGEIRRWLNPASCFSKVTVAVTSRPFRGDFPPLPSSPDRAHGEATGVGGGESALPGLVPGSVSNRRGKTSTAGSKARRFSVGKHPFFRPSNCLSRWRWLSFSCAFPPWDLGWEQLAGGKIILSAAGPHPCLFPPSLFGRSPPYSRPAWSAPMNSPRTCPCHSILVVDDDADNS